MSIYAMKRVFRNGRVAKTPIVYFEAESEDEAYKGFGAGRYWSGYHENTGFAAEVVSEVPRDVKIVSAKKLIEIHEEEEREKWG